MKKVLTLLAVMLFACGNMFGQAYHFVADIDTAFAEGHGIAVDPDGKIWYASYSDRVGIKVLNADLTVPDFAPIINVSCGDVSDTVYAKCRGMNVDQDGNIIAVMNNNKLYRFNYKDGSCTGIVEVSTATGNAGSLTKPAVDGNGNIYLGLVAAGDATNPNPIWQFDKDLKYVDAIIDSQLAWGRALQITPDAKSLFLGTIWEGNRLKRWDTEDGYEYGAGEIFLPADEPFAGDFCGLDWAPDGKLVISDCAAAGSKLWFVNISDYSYEVFNDNDNEEATIQGPRGVAFSPDGKKMYVVDRTAEKIKMYTTEPSAVDNNEAVVTGYSLKQNYPNPFNPTTNICFNLAESGKVSIKIFNVIGQEVAELVNKTLEVGSHEITFNASNLPSGTYFCRMKSGNFNQTTKMLLLK